MNATVRVDVHRRQWGKLHSWLWIVANEEKETIAELVDVFMRHSNAQDIKVIMADKNMVERDVLAKKLPSAALQICFFHI